VSTTRRPQPSAASQRGALAQSGETNTAISLSRAIAFPAASSIAMQPPAVQPAAGPVPGANGAASA
jgi:hypothetical protein